MDVIGVTVKVKTMAADDVTEGEHVEDEELRTMHRALGGCLVIEEQWKRCSY